MGKLRSAAMLPSHDRILSVLSYDPLTGFFTWIAAPSPNKPHLVGQRAGRILDTGYTDIKIDRCMIGAARLAWFYMTGEWPDEEMDHEDVNPANNKWDNIRPATRKQNGANRQLFKNNTSGWKGVSWAAASGKWFSAIKVDRKTKNLGYYDCGAAAHFAYLVAADKAFGEFAKGG
jgi:hypothetical protein